MTDQPEPQDHLGRRNFFVRAIQIVQLAIGGTVAFVLGGSVLAPSFARRDESWLSAGSIDDLRDHVPQAVTIRVARRDGYAQVVDRKVVFLVRTGEKSVTALDSTCTHLGCRTSFDREKGLIVCPCHGGVYDATGKVMGGPPPAPLNALAARVDGTRVMVQV
jgi:menaquinol-cytochrome c reductase iron-sulfur subunit